MTDATELATERRFLFCGGGDPEVRAIRNAAFSAWHSLRAEPRGGVVKFSVRTLISPKMDASLVSHTDVSKLMINFVGELDTNPIAVSTSTGVHHVLTRAQNVELRRVTYKDHEFFVDPDGNIWREQKEPPEC